MRFPFVIGALMVLLLMVSGCSNRSSTAPAQKPPTFTTYSLNGTLNELSNIDERYNTNWKEEKLGSTMMKLSQIGDAKSDIEELRIHLEKQNDTVLLNLVKARAAMLSSQEAYQHAQALDPSGLKTIEYTTVNGSLAVNISSLNKPACEKKDDLLAAASAYERALNSGHDFINLMDEVLQQSIEARDLIGVNDQRPKFYRSPLGKVKTTAELTRLLVGLFCD